MFGPYPSELDKWVRFKNGFMNLSSLKVQVVQTAILPLPETLASKLSAFIFVSRDFLNLLPICWGS